MESTTTTAVRPIDWDRVAGNLNLVHWAYDRWMRDLPPGWRDVVTDAALDGLIEASKRYDGRTKFSYFAALIIRQHMLDAVRKLRRRERIEGAVRDHVSLRSLPARPEAESRPDPAPVWALVEELPPELANAVRIRYRDGLKETAAAAAAGVDNRAWNRLQRKARRQLRKLARLRGVTGD